MSRHPVLVPLVALLVVLIAGLGLIELALRLAAPTALVGVGWSGGEQGRRYGWGFDGGELTAVRDADSGVLYLNRANRRGWRDRDHDFAKPAGTFRVLLLGDSNIFGFVTPAEKTVGRQLEERLNQAGIRAEVISLAYSAWGTDQEVEALEQEGMRYHPDAVVIHFCGNDLTDNLLWRQGGKFGERRPFYYDIGPDGAARRNANPGYKLSRAKLVQEFFFRHSEVVKRAYGGWKALLALRKGRFELTPGQVALMRLWLGDRASDAFADDLRRLKNPDEAMIAAVIHRHGLEDVAPDLLRMAERVNAQEGDVGSMWRAEFGQSDEQWRLFFALARRAKALAEAGGARLLISSDYEDGRWNWDVDWHHVAATAEVKERYLRPNEILRRFTAEEGIRFVEPRHQIIRTRNDAHPNIVGNDAIARNILEALTEGTPAAR